MLKKIIKLISLKNANLVKIYLFFRRVIKMMMIKGERNELGKREIRDEAIKSLCIIR